MAASSIAGNLIQWSMKFVCQGSVQCTLTSCFESPSQRNVNRDKKGSIFGNTDVVIIDIFSIDFGSLTETEQLSLIVNVLKKINTSSVYV